jgi:hypothetical protein
VNSLEAILIEHGVGTEDIEKAKAYKLKVGGALEKIFC